MLEEIFNIQELKELYPLVYNNLLDYIKDLRLDINEVTYLTLLRFFDDNGFYIGISAFNNGEDWYVDISEIQLHVCKSRKEAEITAITECFEMLEKFLNN